MIDNVLDDILAAVKALCGPHDDPQQVVDKTNGKMRLVRVKADGLLSSIRDAIHGGIGSHTGSAPLAEKNVIDAGAFELYTDIEKRISELHFTLTGKPDYLYPEETLVAWYVAFVRHVDSGEVSGCAVEDLRDLLAHWVDRVRAYFDPPRVLEITTDCPTCGERYAFHPRTGEQIPAVVVLFRDCLGPTMLDEATGLCRFCDTVWKGRTALRELRHDIDRAVLGVF